MAQRPRPAGHHGVHLPPAAQNDGGRETPGHPAPRRARRNARAVRAPRRRLPQRWTGAPSSVAAGCAGARGLCPVNTTDKRTWDPFLYVLDVLVPIVDIGHEKAWNPTGLDKVVMVALLVSGWVYATALVAAAGRALSRS